MSKNLTTRMYVLMALLVIAWGLEYVIIKQSLDTFDEMTLVFFKYLIGMVVVGAIKIAVDRKFFMRLKDIPLLVVCAIFGDIGYFALEYNAMNYIPVTLVALIAAFVPAVSVIVEAVVFKKKITVKIAGGITISILAIFCIVGFDYKLLMDGRAIGYLLAFGSVFAWNIYNFATAKLAKEYDAVSLTIYQMICTLLLLAPYVVGHMPRNMGTLDFGIWAGVIFIGMVPAGIGFIIYVKSLDVIGVTASSMFVNFIPVSTGIMGWIILRETLSPFQLAAGAVLIGASCVVIREKGKELKKEKEYAENQVDQIGNEAEREKK